MNHFIIVTVFDSNIQTINEFFILRNIPSTLNTELVDMKISILLTIKCLQNFIINLICYYKTYIVILLFLRLGIIKDRTENYAYTFLFSGLCNIISATIITVHAIIKFNIFKRLKQCCCKHND